MSDLQAPVVKKLDQTVVNRIAAGEVIQRPSNAVKELVENSLDAKSTNIQVSTKNGGLKLLQIEDNGCGIRKDDLKIVCERFTTSKLVEFEDLSTIATYGFRGEALASVSHIAHLSIITKTLNDPCAYKGIYEDGKLIGPIKPCAGNQGTQIIVEDLFYNVPIRKKALTNFNEEYGRIVDVVTRYAIHNPSVGFTLRKQGDSLADVRTKQNSTHIDNVRTVYGNGIASSLEPIEINDDTLMFNLKGYITNANYSVKKQIFLLFINDRLVDSSDLRKGIEQVYSPYLPKGTHPFVYFSLKVDPRNLDVNIHPTKEEVHFLHEDNILAKIKSVIAAKLLSYSTSRTFSTQMTKSSSTVQSVSSGIATSERSNSVVRTDSASQKLDKYFASSTKNKVTQPATEFRRIIKLSSITRMKKTIEDNVNESLKDIVQNFTFVGVATPLWSLIQHKTNLYICNITKLLHETFYQITVTNFGNLGAIKFSEPLNIRQLIYMGLHFPGSAYYSCNDHEKHKIAITATDKLRSRSAMLSDYFSMEIDSSGNLLTIPMLLDNYMPDIEELPSYLLRLATEVIWDSEQPCFETFCRETAQFYAYHYWKDTPTQDHQVTDDEKISGWKWTVEHVLFPCIRKNLIPTNQLSDQKVINHVVSTTKLYSIFERC